MTTVTRTVSFAVKGKRKSDRKEEEPVGRVPRISKLMALAIRYEQMLNDGVVQSQTELAELLHVSQPRITQIMNLLHLSPEIQEEILCLVEAGARRFGVTERELREIVQYLDWDHQRREWRVLAITSSSSRLVT
jgi:predicted XRE-type DNA-binding protein